jgi:DNA-binding winged helix-turn-helix (wHTH) protein/TolB-like protein
MLLKSHVTYRFVGFRLDGRERLLERDGVPVAIGPKVLDALLLLVETPGTLVERSTMRERLWPGQIVEDGTLSRVIADLRKALGDMGDERRYIETVPKFGYRFVATVAAVAEARPAVAEPLEQALPAPVSGRSPSMRKWILGAGIGLVCLAAAGFTVQRIWQQPRAVPSLLIMPFKIIGEAPEAGMIELGLQDSLTMELSGLSGLAVIDGKRQGADATDDVAVVGRRHRAEFVLAGTIQLTSDRIHVNVRLLRSGTGQTVWTRSFEENRDNVFLVQSRLAKLTVAELIPALSAREDERFTRRLPSNALAYRYYLLGRHYWNKRDENAYVNAIEMFKKAAEADHQYAPAYVGLADSYLLATASREDPLAETLPPAKAAVEKAIQIDPWLGEAHATLSMIESSYYFDWGIAEQELQTAIRLSPNYVTAHHWYAEFLTMMGKFDLSEAEFEVARNLDPASPIILTDLAQLYNFEKKYQRSLETLDEVLKLDPSFHLAHNRKGYALMLMHRPQEALREFETANRLAGRRGSIGERAWAAAVEGKRKEAIELTLQAEREAPDAFLLGVIWAELGDFDRAMEWLQKTYDTRRGGLVSLKMNPVFDRLRSFERFRALLRRMNMS